MVRFTDDSSTIAGPWVRAAVVHEARSLRAGASASVIASGTAMSGSVEAESWWRGGARRLNWEAGAEGSALFGSSSHSSESALAAGRLMLAFDDSRGIWLRGSGHLARREAGTLGGAGLEGGGWWTGQYAALTATFQQEWTTAQLFAGATRDWPVGIVPVRYTEATLGVSGTPVWGSYAITAGARRDPGAPQQVEALWSMTALFWQSSHVALTASVARQPADFVHGADAAQSVSIGLRFAERRRIIAAAVAARPTVRVDPTPEGRTRVRVRAPTARTVELMADFTEWETVALSPQDGDFILDASIAPGIHRLAIRIDGGPWHPPANTPAVQDDYGGRVGLLLIGPRPR